jgi:SAM-dependent methyltransferase
MTNDKATAFGATESTVLVEAYRADFAVPLDAGNSYGGIFSNALIGLHAFAGECVAQYVKPGGSILELGAGRGALSKRLVEKGFDVTATDYVAESFQLHGRVAFRQSNLNEKFSTIFPGCYDGIVAVEIIEHLENPRHVARECFKLLAPGGRMILTTPNPDSPTSIASFIRQRRFQWFDEEAYRVDGHIVPITQYQLRACFSEAGFSTVWLGSFGDYRRSLAGSPRLRILSELVRLFSAQAPGLSGEITVAVFERPAEEAVTR